MNIKHIARMYGIEDPLSCLEERAPSHEVFKETVMSKITSFHEKELRLKAATNDHMKYLNVNLMGLRGKYHPCMAGIVTTDEVKKIRPHIHEIFIW